MGLTANDEDDGDDDDGSLLSRVPVPPLSNEGIIVKTISTMMHQSKIRMEIDDRDDDDNDGDDDTVRNLPIMWALSGIIPIIEESSSEGRLPVLISSRLEARIWLQIWSTMKSK